jgi:hypothetical protein
MRNVGVEERALAYPAHARALSITNADDYETAGGILQAIKALRAEIADTFDNVIKQSHAAHKAAVAAKKCAEAPLVEAETEIKRKMVAFSVAEANRKTDEAIQEARAERDRMIEAAKASGDSAKVSTLERLPVRPELLEPEPAVPKVDGITIRKVWSAEVVDFFAFVKWCAEDADRASAYLIVNGTALNDRARQRKREDIGVPGVVGRSTDSIAAGSL